MAILFCRVGWMNNYNGQDDEEIIGGCIADNGNLTGGEIFNFYNNNGMYEGFVMTRKGSEQIRIEKLGAKLNDEFIDGVLVVWMAVHPDEREVRIVGWYKNAKVYRKWQESNNGSRSLQKLKYNIEASVNDCMLLPLNRRDFSIPKATKLTPGYGRAYVWFAQADKNKELVEKVEKYIMNYRKSVFQRIKDSVF